MCSCGVSESMCKGWCLSQLQSLQVDKIGLVVVGFVFVCMGLVWPHLNFKIVKAMKPIWFGEGLTIIGLVSLFIFIMINAINAIK